MNTSLGSRVATTRATDSARRDRRCLAAGDRADLRAAPDPQQLPYARKADWAELAKDLRPVDSAPTERAARSALDELAGKWGDKYPAIIRLWQNAWAEFVPFLSNSPEIRRLIYSTNAIESMQARFRRAVRVRGHFPNEQAAMKCLYLTIRSLDPTAEAANAGATAGSPP